MGGVTSDPAGRLGQPKSNPCTMKQMSESAHEWCTDLGVVRGRCVAAGGLSSSSQVKVKLASRRTLLIISDAPQRVNRTSALDTSVLGNPRGSVKEAAGSQGVH